MEIPITCKQHIVLTDGLPCHRRFSTLRHAQSRDAKQYQPMIVDGLSWLEV